MVCISFRDKLEYEDAGVTIGCNKSKTSNNYLIIRLRKFQASEIWEGLRKMKYKVHQLNIKMTKDQSKLEQFLNGLHGEVIAIVPNVAVTPITRDAQVDFLLIVEKMG